MMFRDEKSTMPQEISQRYGLQIEDARAWYSAVNITAERFISRSALERVLTTLREVQVLKESDGDVTLDGLIESRIAELRTDIKSMKLYSKPELVREEHDMIIIFLFSFILFIITRTNFSFSFFFFLPFNVLSSVGPIGAYVLSCYSIILITRSLPSIDS